jgi:diadenosine tetraphosphate (Ap4A) HIT family hydrolase
MAIIYKSKNFIAESAENPLVDRDDGGHIIISPKVRVLNRQQLSPPLAIELMKLTVMVGQAMESVMNDRGVDIGRINYQDNGNWSVFLPEGPHLHIHLYGRARSAKYHPFGQACFFPHRDENPGYYSRFKPLTAEDIKSLRKEIEKLSGEEKFSDHWWGPGTPSVSVG